jgi:hypothetical protein
MTKVLLNALEASDAVRASEQLRKELDKGSRPWEIHLSLFPVVQRVLNPPFINPHLPKMYRIIRELVPCLEGDEISALVDLEVREYAGRPKLAEFSNVNPLLKAASFHEIESAIGEKDPEKTAALMAAFNKKSGPKELARRFLLLGSGYLDQSLGHSVSCTAFILLEMLDRANEDPWPAIMCLADYFCKGSFRETPDLEKSSSLLSDDTLDQHAMRATSGSGIVNLHHTITLYAIERVRHLFSQEQCNHLILAWIAFMGGKDGTQVVVDHPALDPPADYARFYETFSELDAKSVVASLLGLTTSQKGRQRLCRFLTRGLCDRYQGNYNPHYLTGLGSALWVVDRYWKQPFIVTNALFQYIDFFFEGTRPGQ